MTDVSHPPHGGPATWWRLGLIATSIAALAIGAVAVTGSGPEPDPSGAPAASTAPTSPTATRDEEPAPRRSAAASDTTSVPFGDQVIHEGDAVTAAGTVIRETGEPAMICRTLPIATVLYPAGEEPPPGCSPLAVALSGVDESAIPGWIERDGVWFTAETVTVTGVWRDDALAVGTATAGGSPWGPELDSWQVPCAPPSDGWVDGDGLLSAGLEPEAYEAMMAALATELATHPDRYHSNWIGYPDGDPALSPQQGDLGEPIPAHQVMIVSTVDDPVEVQANLATIYSGNLCVTRVDRSTVELDAVVERLTLLRSWVVDAHSLHTSLSNRVLIELPVLDEAAATLIGADADLVEVWSLVRLA